MPVREWDAQSHIRVATVEETEITTALTLLAFVAPHTKDNWESLICARGEASAPIWSFGMTPANVLYFYKNSGNKLFVPDPVITITPDVWSLVCYTNEDVDSEVGFFRVYEVGEEPIHQEADTGVGLPNLLDAPVYFQMGQTDAIDGYWGLYEVAAIRNSFLSEADFDAIGSARQTSELLSRAFGGVWKFSQAETDDPIPDLAGNHADIVGTISGDDPNGVEATEVISGTAPWDEIAVGTPGLKLKKGGVWVSAIRRKRIGGEWV